jgi:glycogen synthase
VRVLTVGNMYPPHHHGGYELVWESAVEHLRARGHEVRVLTTDTRTDAVASDAPDVHRELRWPLRNARLERLGPRERVAVARHNHRTLDRHLDELRPDVVAWWSMGGLTLTMLESVRRRGLPAVAFVHDDWLDYGRKVDGWLNMWRGDRQRFAPLAERLAGIPAGVDFDGSATYMFGSERTRRHTLSRGVTLTRTGVAQLGIHPDYLDPAPPQEWRWRLLYVGRLDPRKGVDTAVEAVPHLSEETTLELIGGWDSQEEERLRGIARDLGILDRVIFSGHRGRDEIAAAYAACDAAIFPVRWEEPWGLVPLEAMGKGRPVVATGRGGSAEYLRDGENCLLFEADDAEALADALRRLAADPGLRARLREGGLETAARFTEPLYNEAVESALRAALGAPLAAAA